MSFERIGGLLPKLQTRSKSYTLAELKSLYPSVSALDVADDEILRGEALLLELVAQDRICGNCRGYELCGKTGDAKGMWYTLSAYQGSLMLETGYCKSYLEHLVLQRVEKFRSLSTRGAHDKFYTFANFPDLQKQRRQRLFHAAERFANTFKVEAEMKGIYIFGPAGVGKTHLLHAMVNRLEERRIPSIFINADALFDRLRSLIGEGKDIEPVLEAFSSVPVLAIDEIGQERANEFTLEKLFRIINQRFARKLPTLFASNYAPPDLYRRLPEEFLPFIDPLKSRIFGMCQVGYLDGDDYRLMNMEVLDDDA